MNLSMSAIIAFITQVFSFGELTAAPNERGRRNGTMVDIHSKDDRKPGISSTHSQREEYREMKSTHRRKALFLQTRPSSFCCDKDNLLTSKRSHELVSHQQGTEKNHDQKMQSWNHAREDVSLDRSELLQLMDCTDRSASDRRSSTRQNQYARRRSLSFDTLLDIEVGNLDIEVNDDEKCTSDLEEVQRRPSWTERQESSNSLCYIGFVCTVALLFIAFFNKAVVYQPEVIRSDPEEPLKLFVHVPKSSRKIACVDRQSPVRRAFESRGYEVRSITHKNYEQEVLDCALHGEASIIWTKDSPSQRTWKASRQWQRHSWLPFQDVMSTKSDFIENLRDHAKRTGRIMEFLPDSYVLPHDHEALLKRMKPSSQGGGDGWKEPWVVKLPGVDNGIGIAMLGPESSELSTLQHILESSEARTNGVPDMSLTHIRDKIIFEQKHDTRKDEHMEYLKQSVPYLDQDIIVQSYVCDELTYKNKKFDLRVYFLVASADPVVVLYHDGALRVSVSDYQEQDFSKTADHLTNISRNGKHHNASVVFSEWEDDLKEYVSQDPGRFSSIVLQDPLMHIRNQMKAAIAEVVASVSDKAFRGYRDYTTMENGFALMGADFIIDRDLNVWMTEAQSSPGFGDTTPSKRKMLDSLLTSTVDIIEEVTTKQVSGESILPLQNVGSFEIVYRPDFQFTYSGRRSVKKNTCAIKKQS